jgi:hypothetical protein
MSSRPKSLSGEAAQFYKSGQPFLQHNLPFWMASLVGHLLVLLIPIVAVLYPMMRFPAAQFVWSSGADYVLLRLLPAGFGTKRRLGNVRFCAACGG